jgi:hypothetical protein
MADDRDMRCENPCSWCGDKGGTNPAHDGGAMREHRETNARRVAAGLEPIDGPPKGKSRVRCAGCGCDFKTTTAGCVTCEWRVRQRRHIARRRESFEARAVA